MTGMWQDVRFATRQFAARPLFTLTAVATIALGIGANAAIFSVVNGLLLDPLPFDDADRLAQVWRTSPTSEMMLTPNGAIVEEWRAGARSFDAIEAWTTGEAVVRTAAGPRVLRTASVSDGFMPALRLPPSLGRGFVRDDEAPAAEPVVLLASAFWHAEYGAAEDIVGRSLTVAGTPHTIIGVAPPELIVPMDSGDEPQLWLPLRRQADGRLAGAGLRTLVRVPHDVPWERAEAELSAISGRTVEAGGDANFSTARIVRPADLLGAATQRALFVLLGAVALVLLIACANVANLLLVRASARQTELAVRAALGAGRSRLIRQMLVESVLLGTVGGSVGIILAYWGLDLIVSIRPDSLAELERVRIDGRVAGYAALLALGTSALFGALPALRAARLATDLRTGTRTATGGRGMRRTASALIVAEVALSLLLLVGAGLLVRTFLTLQATPLHFQPAGLWTATVELPPAEGGGGGGRDGLVLEELRDRITALPGVRSADLVLGVPPDYGVSFGALAMDGGEPLEDGPSMFASNFVPPAYFQTLGMQFTEGRAFTDADGADVVVVGEAFARRFFEGSAVGHRIRIGPRGTWRTIVGVAADLPAQGLARTAGFDQMHFPVGSFTPDKLLISTDLPADALAPALRAAIAAVDAEAALADLSTVEELLAQSLDRQRFNLTLLLVLAVLATLLSAVGLYGVVGVAVAGRTREIGIRRALGASNARVVRLVVLEGVRPALIGLGIGLIAALALARLMTNLLYGLSPHDPVTLALVPVVLGSIALLASWLPGRRAARIEPSEALRID